MNKPVLLFDGVCNLCNGSVQFIIKRDKKNVFLFASLQSEAGQERLKKFDLPVDDYESFVLVEGDKFYRRSTAALRTMKKLGGLWKLLYAFIIIPAPIRDFVYSIIARNRYKWFGRNDQCMIPTPELKAKFLD
ncbi:thiol-disulfide oxidoreductase DCC family protein [Fulvivirgaceae bacterium BMA10]|uniref:Thiol-disulfide oxidoreductase DCC family protein n=1 Tax=Splendidivirga corallicola TaxID=3051826 RepID=A0ABT8KLM3_9BACT|nr:thiol-disulfide oxidoreductase DCC family protein [Fulvivirgaceae bacterium BMA10]